MALRNILLLLTIVGIAYSQEIPSCLYPCAWRGDAIPLLIERESIWVINTPTVGIYTNTSSPKGDQRTTSECIMRDGPFFIIRGDGVFACFKYIPISDTEWYYYMTEASADLKDFCTLCDDTKMAGPFYMTGRPSSADRTKPIGCTRPFTCQRKNNQQVCCSDEEPFDSGMNCKRQHHNRRQSRYRSYGRYRSSKSAH